MVSLETHEKIQKKNMSYKQAVEIIGNNRPRWELLAMKKALSSIPLMNSIEEEYRLKAIKILLKNRIKKH